MDPISPSHATTRSRLLAMTLIAGAMTVAVIVLYVRGQPEQSTASALETREQANPSRDLARATVAQVPISVGRNTLASEVEVTPVLHAQVMRERAMDLDQNFNEDMRDPAWAAATENRIGQIIAGARSINDGDYGISAEQVECRSHGCKINLTFPDDELADEATMMIRRELVAEFNQTLTVPIRNPDGSVQYRMYAVAPGHGNLLRKRRPDSVEAGAYVEN